MRKSKQELDEYIQSKLNSGMMQVHATKDPLTGAWIKKKDPLLISDTNQPVDEEQTDDCDEQDDDEKSQD